MKKIFLHFIVVGILLLSCGKKEEVSGPYPSNFGKIGDVGRVEYMMHRVTPDSLARFVINSALGRNPGAPIDTLAIASLYIYDNLKGDDLEKFSVEYESYIETFSLEDKLKIHSLAGSEDDQKIGYRLGLEYLGQIREKNKNAAQVEKEIESFRKACGNDTAMFRRFLTGFHTVLDVDSGKDVSADIYNKFKDYE